MSQCPRQPQPQPHPQPQPQYHVTDSLNAHQLLQAYLEIGGFRSNPERNATDPCVMNAILSVLDK